MIKGFYTATIKAYYKGTQTHEASLFGLQGLSRLVQEHELHSLSYLYLNSWQTHPSAHRQSIGNNNPHNSNTLTYLRGPSNRELQSMQLHFQQCSMLGWGSFNDKEAFGDSIK